MALPTELLRTIQGMRFHLSPGSDLRVEGTDASTEGSLSILLRAPQENQSELIRDWSEQFVAGQSLQNKTLQIEFPQRSCQEGACVKQVILRLPKRILLDLNFSGWKSARLRNVRARALEVVAPAQGFLRMNGTLANILLTGGGPAFEGVISGVLASDPNNPNAGDLSAHLDGFHTLLLARIQGHITIESETSVADQYLRINDEVISQLPYERP